MKVKDLMTLEPRVCAPGTSVAAAAKQMWDGDCGFLPVVDDGKLVGAVTDRDMYIALATRNRLASELTVGEVATATVITAVPEENVQEALDRMTRALVRRLPVVGPGGVVVGVITLDDIARAAGPRKAIRSDDVLRTLQAICAHHPHVTPVAVA
jgi:CBS domain-containing protein